jgi:hypothetical protein
VIPAGYLLMRRAGLRRRARVERPAAGPATGVV